MDLMYMDIVLIGRSNAIKNKSTHLQQLTDMIGFKTHTKLYCII